MLTVVEKQTNVYQETVAYFSKSPKWKNLLYEPVVLKRTKIPKGQLNGQFIIDIEDSDLRRQFSAIIQEFLRRVEA